MSDPTTSDPSRASWRQLPHRILTLAGAPATPSSRVPHRPGRLASRLVAGVVAGVLAAAASLGLRHLTGAPSLPEDLQDLIVPFIPASTFERLFNALGPSGKQIVVAGSIAGVTVAVTAVGWLYGMLCARGWRPARLAGMLWAAGVLANVAIFRAVLDANDRGGTLLARRTVGITNVAVVVAVAALTVYLLTGRRERPDITGGAEPARGTALSRRRFLHGTAQLGGGLVLGAGALYAALRSFAGATNLGYEGRGTPSFPRPAAITPTAQHYVVSKNLIDPGVDAGAWRLEITGLVERPVTLTLDDLRALPRVEVPVTLECIANGVGGTLMSTARWGGPLLRDVLARAGAIGATARYAVITAVDGYDDSLPVATLGAPGVMLALDMNGVPLPDRHGFPARILNPGHYGEKQMKWLARIELSETDHLGFYQREGYTENAEVTTFSRVDNLREGSHVPVGRNFEVVGHAYSGTRGITRVEVSVDDGMTYADATLDAPISPYAWRFWSWAWTPSDPGRHSMVVRATDGTGAVQEDRYVDYVPRGASGLHRFGVVVA